MNDLSRVLSKTVTWKVLRFFLDNPSEEIHVNGLAREVGISTSSSSRCLKELWKANVLVMEEKANALFYSLNNESLTVRQVKRMNTVMELEGSGAVEAFLEDDDALLSIVLYGSCASGENDAHSDTDILVISDSEGKTYDAAVEALLKVRGGEVNVITFTLPAWYDLKEKDPVFHESVLSSHVILWGSEVP